MITLQTRAHAADPWRNVHQYAQYTPSMGETVLRSRLEARLVDLARDTILAQSLPALGIPVTKDNMEDAVRLFA